ncbi:unnamed protein product [Miscanthus lutarioriparius]|uniref:Uncharacterized protein n=1 Tax=Miscanthus lutarioriparius TaxID=422564 RepID=A0A811P387_9POAL|nr:unnamed protein product [Miscanthus lutarioriparius]
MADYSIRCFILQADVAVLTPRWCRLRLRTERQECLGHDELHLFIDPKLKHGVGDVAIPVGLACHGHEFKNLGLRKDVLPLLVGEIELLQLHECPHQATKDIMDTFLVVGDAHDLIRLQDLGGAASFV